MGMVSEKLNQLAALASAPILFERNEVWRVYTGGKLFRELRGRGDARDSYYPEDWIASMTRADNPPRDGQPALEGLSVIRGTETPFALLVELFPEPILGREHLAAFGATTRVLAKFLDSAVRLPIQAHPDDQLAQRYFDSPVGKTEAWVIVNTRSISGVEPYILMDFRPGIDAARFRRMVDEQDLEGQVASLNRIAVRPGDVYLVTGRTPHAIGSGVFMVEVQQPSDLVIHTERKVVEVEIPEEICHMGLGWDRAMEVFDFTGRTQDETLARARLRPREIARAGGGAVEQLIGHEDTPFFASRRLTITGELECPNERFYAGAVIGGSGRLSWARGAMDLRAGDTFFIPNSVHEHKYRAASVGTRGNGPLQIITAEPPVLSKATSSASDLVVGRSHTARLAKDGGRP
jgi:mannose-6-phosphate isomerase